MTLSVIGNEYLWQKKAENHEEKQSSRSGNFIITLIHSTIKTVSLTVSIGCCIRDNLLYHLIPRIYDNVPTVHEFIVVAFV
jgi:hypothetical protein